MWKGLGGVLQIASVMSYAHTYVLTSLIAHLSRRLQIWKCIDENNHCIYEYHVNIPFFALTFYEEVRWEALSG